MAINFPNAPTVGDTFQPPGSLFIYSWNGTSWIIPPGVVASIGHGQCRLVVDSTTVIRLLPYDGNLIRIEGATRVLPAAGITIDNAGTAANQTLNVFVFDNAGTLELELSAVGRATDVSTVGNIGVEIKGGDPTRTLVGKVRLSNGNLFGRIDSAGVQDFDLINWFNREQHSGFGIMGSDLTGIVTDGVNYVRLSAMKIGFLSWGDEHEIVWAEGTHQPTSGTVGQSIKIAIYDNAIPPVGTGSPDFGSDAYSHSDINFVYSYTIMHPNLSPDGYREYGLYTVTTSPITFSYFDQITGGTTQTKLGVIRNG